MDKKTYQIATKEKLDAQKHIKNIEAKDEKGMEKINTSNGEITNGSKPNYKNYLIIGAAIVALAIAYKMFKKK